jgi:hypothetical protein
MAQDALKGGSVELRRCPKCSERQVRLLDIPSRAGDRWYFRCDECAHLWNTPKDEAATLPAGQHLEHAVGVTPARRS